MKDKLRELAEMVRDAYRAGFIAACKWPSPVSQDVDSSAYNKEFNAWSFSVREKHAAILDAEGDGGAVPAELFAWLTERDLVPDVDEDGSFDMHLLIEALNEHENELQASNPARSGVVSDEECREFLCKIPLSAAHTPIEMVRAALEHYERTRK